MNNMIMVRATQKMTQQEVAKKLNISRSVYSMWEEGKDIIPSKRLADFCNLFNVSADFVLKLSNDSSSKRKKCNVAKCGERLKNFRIRNKLTQDDVAAILDINSRSIISDYERGRYIIPTIHIITLCSNFNVTADYFLGR